MVLWGEDSGVEKLEKGSCSLLLTFYYLTFKQYTSKLLYFKMKFNI